MKRILGRCVLWTALVIEILSAVWMAFFLLDGADTHVYTSMVRYLPEGAEVIEEWQRKDGTAFLAVQIPQDGVEEFVRVLEEENFEKGPLPNYLPRKREGMPREIKNGLRCVDVPPNRAQKDDVTYHVYDLDTGIYYYVIGD